MRVPYSAVRGVSFVPFFLHHPATAEIYALSLHDALPILDVREGDVRGRRLEQHVRALLHQPPGAAEDQQGDQRSEEHTSELQSLRHLVCRLLLEKKNIVDLSSPNVGINISLQRRQILLDD